MSIYRIAYSVLLLLFCASPLSAAGLKQALHGVLEDQPRVLRSQEERAASDDTYMARIKDAWTPNFSAGASYGSQTYESIGESDMSTKPQEVTLRATQLVYDFGQSSSNIDAQEFTVKQKGSQLEVTRQDVLLDALRYYILIQRASSVLGYALQSESKIRGQTQMETIMVEEGRGYSSNILQAKTQLAGAKARVNQSRADLAIAKAHLRAVMRSHMDDITFDEKIRIGPGMLPERIDDAILVAREENPRLMVGRFRTKALGENIDYERSRSFFPRFNVVGELKRYKDKDGDIGSGRNDKVLFEVSLPLNLGLSGLDKVQAATKLKLASLHEEKATLDQVEENLRIAWRNYQTSVENVQILEVKASIAGEFFRLAQEERKLGRRSLLEVLTAETTWINSLSEHAAAKAELLISSFTLIHAMGKLSMDVVDTCLESDS